MERLTFDGNFCDIALCSEVRYGSFCEDGSCSQRRVWERLKSIEDILGGDYNLDRLRELAEAERKGRCVVLPCMVGDNVYVLNHHLVECLKMRLLGFRWGTKAITGTVCLLFMSGNTDLKHSEGGNSNNLGKPYF